MADNTQRPEPNAQPKPERGSGTRVVAIAVVVAAVIAAAIIIATAKKPGRRAVTPATGATAGTPRTEVLCLVPCGLQGPYGKIKDLYEAQNPNVEITQEVQNTALLVRGVESGKIAGDLLFTLGDREVEYLRNLGKVQGDAVPFAENAIAVLVPRDNPAGLRADRFEDVASDRVKHMGLPTSDINSVGYYGEQALERAGLLPKLEGRLVRRAEPSMVGKLSAQKKIDCGILYASCLLEATTPGGGPTPRKKTKGLAEVPHEYYDRFYCQAAVLTGAQDPAAARAFAEFWLTDAAQDVLEEAGFGRMEKATEPAA